jgi:hypothetical protein
MESSKNILSFENNVQVIKKQFHRQWILRKGVSSRLIAGKSKTAAA